MRAALFTDLDLRGARLLHRAAGRPWLLRLNRAASRLADGPLWVALLLLLPLLDGASGRRCAWLMLATGALNLTLYLALKHSTRRQRPYQRCAHIRACLSVPDAFSFPSGHTLHAVALGQVLTATYPSLALPCGAFAALVATSRVVLGLHYPSDVLVGGLLGLGTAQAVLSML